MWGGAFRDVWIGRIRLGSILAIAAFAAACGGAVPTPTAPTASAPTDITAPAPIPAAPCTIGFEGLAVNGAPFGTHVACGLTLTAGGADWRASTTYGVPAPFIQFIVPAGSTVTGDVTVASAHGTFSFLSVDLYSSTTKIPYEMKGEAGGAVVFSMQGVVGNTFGNFATVSNPHGATAVETLRIRLTNPAAPCCGNPVGLDNIRVMR